MSNTRLVRETTDAMDAYASGRAGFDELQAKFQSVMTLMERRSETDEAVEAIGAAEADLEYIRFMVFGDDFPTPWLTSSTHCVRISRATARPWTALECALCDLTSEVCGYLLHG